MTLYPLGKKTKPKEIQLFQQLSTKQPNRKEITMNYKTEHPDFTLPEGITIPDGFVDTSRSNHLCPNWTDYNNNIVLFIDYEDGEMGARFTLNFDSLDQDGMVLDQWQDWNDIEICDNPLCCFRSNHWKAILKAISQQPNRKDSKMSKAEILLMNIVKGRYGTNLEDCIEWVIVKYFDDYDLTTNSNCPKCDFEFNEMISDANGEEFIPEHYCLDQGTGDVEDDWVESQ